MKKIIISMLLLLSICFTFTSCEAWDNTVIFFQNIFSFGNNNPDIDDNRSVILNETQLTLDRDSTYELKASLSVGKADFVWSSSDEAVATVDQNGVVTAVSVGTATITATADDKSAVCEITVVLPDNVPVFEVNNQELDVLHGKTFAINTTVLYNGEKVDASYKFTSLDTDIVTVSDEGVVKGESIGEAVVQVVAEYMGMSVYMDVKVVVRPDVIIEAPTATVNLDTINIPQLGFNCSEELWLTVLNYGEDVTDELDISWVIEDNAVASLAPNGSKASVKAITSGSTIVTASFTLDGFEYQYLFDLNVIKSDVHIVPVKGEMSIDLSAVEGDITGLTIDGESYMDSIVNNHLVINKKDMSGGAHEAVLTTNKAKYVFSITAEISVVTIDKEIIDLTDGNFVIDISDIDIVDTVYSAIIGIYDPSTDKISSAKDYTTYYSEKVLTIPRSAIAYGGDYRLSLTTEGGTDYVMDIVLYSSQINNETTPTPKDFADTLIAYPTGNFVITEDIDWSGEMTHGVINFEGRLDGQGHRLSNFRIDINAADSGNASYLFASNSGTISNTAFEYTMTSANGQNALIVKNTGTVENCLVKVHYAFSQNAWTIAPIATTHTEKGIISNCITIITAEHGKYNTAYDGGSGKGVGAIVSGYLDPASVKNSYSIHNGIVINDYPYIEKVGSAPVEGYKGYVSVVDLMSEISSLDSSLGWSNHWSIQSGNIYFGGKAICDIVYSLADKKVVGSDAELKYIIDLSGDDIGIPTSIKLNNIDYISKYLDGKLSIPLTEIEAGMHIVDIESDKGKFTFKLTLEMPILAAIELNAENAGTPALFAQMLKNNPGRDFVLTADLDWNNASTMGHGMIDFSGTLDGQGYAIKNFNLSHSAGVNTNGADAWISALFGVNTGTIKNIGFEYILASANDGNTGLIYDNRGTVENVFVNTVHTAYSWCTGTIVAANRGIIKNCVVNITKTDAYTELSRNAFVGVDYNGTVQDCYVIHNGVFTGDRLTKNYNDTWGSGVQKNFATYATLSEFLADASKTAFNADNGWNTTWKATDNGISFGSVSIQ